MIRTLWTSFNQIALVIANALAETGILHQAIDLGTVFNEGDYAAIELEAVTNATAPGVATMTLWYAFSSYQNRVPSELLTAASSLVCTLPNTASVRRVYLAPVLYQGARYLHIWFDHQALNAGATVTVTANVNAQS